MKGYYNAGKNNFKFNNKKYGKHIKTDYKNQIFIGIVNYFFGLKIGKLYIYNCANNIKNINNSILCGIEQYFYNDKYYNCVCDRGSYIEKYIFKNGKYCSSTFYHKYGYVCWKTNYKNGVIDGKQINFISQSLKKLNCKWILNGEIIEEFPNLHKYHIKWLLDGKDKSDIKYKIERINYYKNGTIYYKCNYINMYNDIILLNKK
jgi:hypothetical protein